MRIGISVTSVFGVSDVREGARFMVERARAADAAGLDSLFVGDHHAMPRPYYQNTAILGRLLAEWGERPAGALYLLPLWHPLLLAEQIGTLASIARGRFIVQCGLGPDDRQFPAMGVSPQQRRARFEASLGILRRLLAGETLDTDGPWKLRGARIAPRPPEPVEFWIGAVAEPAIERAARLGDGWLASPGLPPDAARRDLECYRGHCERLGRPLGTTAIRRDVYVGASPEEADATGGTIVRSGYRGLPPGATVVGDVEQVTAAFRHLAAMGYTDVIVRNLVSDQPAALASIERLTEVRRRIEEP